MNNHDLMPMKPPLVVTFYKMYCGAMVLLYLLCTLAGAAALLDPELLVVEPADLGRCWERDGRGSFDELIDYIRANLDQPLRLSDLEARSHYSKIGRAHV